MRVKTGAAAAAAAGVVVIGFFISMKHYFNLYLREDAVDNQARDTVFVGQHSFHVDHSVWQRFPAVKFKKNTTSKGYNVHLTGSSNPVTAGVAAALEHLLHGREIPTKLRLSRPELATLYVICDVLKSDTVHDQVRRADRRLQK